MKRRRGPDRDRPAHHPTQGDPDEPGQAAARARVEALLEQFTRVQLQVVVVGPPDAARLAARDRARTAAIVSGRGALLEEATAAAREATIRTFARSGFSGTWAATDMAVSVVRADDRVAAASALQEAASAAVVEDLVDDETLEVLRSSWNDLVGLRGIPSPGSLSAFATPTAIAIRGPVQVTIAVMFVILLTAVGLAAGPGYGLILLALAVAIVTGLIRRGRQPD